MRLVIVSSDNKFYYIGLERGNWGVETYQGFIMSVLNIDEDKYKKILKHHGGIDDHYFNFYFDEYENIQNCIEELIPYLIMSKLTGD